MRLFSILALFLMVSCSSSEKGAIGSSCKTNADCTGATDTCQSVGGKMQCAAQTASNCKTPAVCTDGFECASDHKCECGEKAHCAINERCFANKCGFRRVFVSSVAFRPGEVEHNPAQSKDRFAGIRGDVGANAACQHLGSKAFPNTKWAAWIADKFVSAYGNISGKLTDNGTVDVYLVNGTKVSGPIKDKVNTKPQGDFTSTVGAGTKTHDTGINIDENGKPTDSLNVWTGTQGDAFTKSTPEDSCGNWGSESGNGVYGLAALRDRSWTAVSSQPCSASYPLYCVELDK